MEANILIVGKDTGLLRGLSEQLTGSGFIVTSATDYSSALMKLDEVDMVIIDTDLSNDDAKKICEQVRSYRDIPILLIARNIPEEKTYKVWELEVDMYETKLFSYPLLAARVKAALRRHKLSRKKDSDRQTESSGPGDSVDIENKAKDITI